MAEQGGQVGVIDVAAEFAALGLHAVELAAQLSTAEATRAAGRIQRQLRLIEGAFVATEQRAKLEREVRLEVVETAAYRITLEHLGLLEGEVSTHRIESLPSGTTLVRVLTVDGVTLGVSIDDAWRVSDWTPAGCLSCDDTGVETCPTCSGQGTVNGARCSARCRDGATGCDLCVSRSKAVA